MPLDKGIGIQILALQQSSKHSYPLTLRSRANSPLSKWQQNSDLFPYKYEEMGKIVKAYSNSSTVEHFPGMHRPCSVFSTGTNKNKT